MAPKLTTRPLRRISRFRPGNALLPPSNPNGLVARRSERMEAVMGRRNSTYKSLDK